MIIVITGALGVGKTTISKEVSKSIDAVYVSVDKELHEHKLDLIAEGSYCIPLKNFLQANRYMQIKIAKAIASHRHVVVDGCFYHSAALEDLLEHFPKPYAVFTLQAPVHVCISRDAKREHPLGEEAARAVYHLTSKLVLGDIIDTTQSKKHGVDHILRIIDSHNSKLLSRRPK